jgi:nitroreductase
LSGKLASAAAGPGAKTAFWSTRVACGRLATGEVENRGSHVCELSKVRPICCRLAAVTAELEVLERLMDERRSERQFLPDEIPQSVIARLLHAACSAPSASNRQPYRFMVVQRRKTIARMVHAVEISLQHGEHATLFQSHTELSDYGKHFLVFGQAPVVFIAFFRAGGFICQGTDGDSTVDEVIRVRETLSSAAAATMQLLLAVHAMGLGACWMTGPCLAEKALLDLLKVPPGLRIAAVIPVGYSATRSLPPKKRNVAQLQLLEPEDESAH